MSGKADAIKAAIVFGALGGGMLFTAFRRFLRARKLADTSACPVSSMPAGFGEAQGIAWPTQVYRDSFGNNVVYLEQYVEEYVKRGKNGSWVVRANFLSNTGLRHFYLLDHSGLAKVFPQNAETSLKEVTRGWAALSNEQANFVLANVGGHISPSGGFLGFSRWRVREKKVLVANPLLVQGNFLPYATHQVIDDAAISYLKQKLGRFLNPLARAKLPFDLNRDGKVDEKEMRIGMAGTVLLAEKFRNTAAQGTTLHKHAVCGEFREHSEHKLFFADVHEADLIKRIGSWNALIFVAGACAIGFSLFMAFGKMK